MVWYGKVVCLSICIQKPKGITSIILFQNGVSYKLHFNKIEPLSENKAALILVQHIFKNKTLSFCPCSVQWVNVSNTL
jgi:hypothetical protein